MKRSHKSCPSVWSSTFPQAEEKDPPDYNIELKPVKVVVDFSAIKTLTRALTMINVNL